jgi:hypothetical protein
VQVVNPLELDAAQRAIVGRLAGVGSGLKTKNGLLSHWRRLELEGFDKELNGMYVQEDLFKNITCFKTSIPNKF